MNELPILFKGPMVTAVLADTKTQTRRVVKPQPTSWASNVPGSEDVGGLEWRGVAYEADSDEEQRGFLDKCPYGKPGDRLWVRETWRPWGWTEDGGPWTFQYAADMQTRRERAQAIVGDKYNEWNDRIWRQVSDECEAAGLEIDEDGNFQREPDDTPPKWRPSIFLPRWGSRIDLLVKSVRVERLQEISEADAIAEGLKAATKDGSLYKYGVPDRDGLPGTDDHGWAWKEWEVDAVQAYRKLWDSINRDKAPWSSNPWVWVVEFEREG